MSEASHNAEAIRHMDMWALWKAAAYERGWPKVSHEVRAYERHMQSTVTNGIARYRAMIQLETRRVRKLPPAPPKETRPCARSTVPDIDLSRTGPKVDAMLKDMSAQSDWWLVTACVLIASVTSSLSVIEQARSLGLKRRRYYKRLNRGYEWLGRAIDAKERALTGGTLS